MRFLSLFICIFESLFLSFSSSVTTYFIKYDVGPKPYTEINIYNLEQSDYIVSYATKNEEYFGPHHSFIPGDEVLGITYFGDANDLTLIYNNINLPEGWFLSDISTFYENARNLKITSGYFWPSNFILIIFNKLNNSYFLSEETNTYAFRSYFVYDMNNFSGSLSLEKLIVLEESYNYGYEFLTFIVRLLLTIFIECLLAIVFKFDKKSLIIILGSNAITQIGLNLGLNVYAYLYGKNPFLIFIYALIELLVMLIEAIIYKVNCVRTKERTKKWIISYAILANITSFVIGMFLWFLI